MGTNITLSLTYCNYNKTSTTATHTSNLYSFIVHCIHAFPLVSPVRVDVIVVLFVCVFKFVYVLNDTTGVTPTVFYPTQTAELVSYF